MTDADIVSPDPVPKTHRPNRARIALIQFLVVLCLIAIAIAFFQSSLTDRRNDCQRRMEQLAAATLHYALDHGAYPIDLKTCPELGRLNSRNLICPNSSLEADPPRADEISGALNAREPISYIYVGAGVKDTHAHNVVIWLEPKEDHADRGINVAFADGAVQWMEREDADRILAQVAAGTRPVEASLESATHP